MAAVTITACGNGICSLFSNLNNLLILTKRVEAVVELHVEVFKIDLVTYILSKCLRAVKLIICGFTSSRTHPCIVDYWNCRLAGRSHYYAPDYP